MTAQNTIRQGATADVLSLDEARQRRDAPSPHRALAASMAIVLIEWRIIKGREDEFLAYWSIRAKIADRGELIGEFLNHVKEPDDAPWMTWEFSDEWTTYVNVGLWRDTGAFAAQVGHKIVKDDPKLPFEFMERRRTCLGPERWRLGGCAMPTDAHCLVI